VLQHRGRLTKKRPIKEVRIMATVNSTNVRMLDLDEYSELTKRTAQLTALLATLYGAGYQSFKDYNEEIQENTLWLAHDLAYEIDQLLDRVEMREVSQ